MEEKCVGCYNIREKNYPTYGYSEIKKAYIMHVAAGWKDPNKGDKPLKLAYIKFCPVCGKKLERE